MSAFFEILEDRQLFSGNPFVVPVVPVRLAGTELIVNGSDKNDTLSVTKSGTNLLVSRNGVVSTFNAADVKSISMYGYAGRDVLSVAAEITTPAKLDGGSEDDQLTGGGGDDCLLGGTGNDLLRGRDGADVMSGGDGSDTATYDEKTRGVIVTLDGVANDGIPAQIQLIGSGLQVGVIHIAAENDNVQTDVENVRGTDFDDKLTGSSIANALYGLKGNDHLEGGAGDDYLCGDLGADDINGNAGIDTVHYDDTAGRTRGVTVTLDNIANDGQTGEGDNVHTDVEVVYGTNYADVITGSAHAETFFGLGGNDQIFGGAGADELHGGADDDSLAGQGGKDKVFGDTGINHADQDQGQDTLTSFSSVFINGVPDGSAQNDSWSCGPNSASRLLRWYGKNVSYTQLRDERQYDTGLVNMLEIGTTSDTMLQLLNNHKSDNHLEERVALTVSDGGLGRILSLLQAGKPVIALINPSGDTTDLGLLGTAPKTLHWILLNGFDRATHGISFMDTNGEQKSMSFSSFKSKWNWTDSGVTGAGLDAIHVKPRTILF